MNYRKKTNGQSTERSERSASGYATAEKGRTHKQNDARENSTDSSRHPEKKEIRNAQDDVGATT